MRSGLKSLLVISILCLTSSAHGQHYDSLRSNSQADLYFKLKWFIYSGGYDCEEVTKSRFQGIDSDGNGFIVAACSNGEDYVVMIVDDAVGSTKTIPCSELAKSGINCWESWRNVIPSEKQHG